MDLEESRKCYLRGRWLESVLYYDQAGSKNNWGHAVLSMIVIVAGAIIPVLATLNLEGDIENRVRFALVLLGIVVSICTAIDGFFRFGDRWRHNRLIAEQLQSEGWDYINLSGRYRGYRTHRLAYQTFAERVEVLSREEVDRYITQVIDDRATRDNRPEDDAGTAGAPRGQQTIAPQAAVESADPPTAPQ